MVKQQQRTGAKTKPKSKGKTLAQRTPIVKATKKAAESVSTLTVTLTIPTTSQTPEPTDDKSIQPTQPLADQKQDTNTIHFNTTTNKLGYLSNSHKSNFTCPYKLNYTSAEQ
jgi:hypothetical protein